MWLAKRKVVNPVMFVIADHQQYLADQRMEPIRNNDLKYSGTQHYGPGLDKARKTGVGRNMIIRWICRYLGPEIETHIFPYMNDCAVARTGDRANAALLHNIH